ncbi:hypothetical protein D9M72_650920 [compost metagenome]
MLLGAHVGLGELVTDRRRTGEEVLVESVEKARAGAAAAVTLHHTVGGGHDFPWGQISSATPHHPGWGLWYGLRVLGVTRLRGCQSPRS